MLRVLNLRMSPEELRVVYPSMNRPASWCFAELLLELPDPVVASHEHEREQLLGPVPVDVFRRYVPFGKGQLVQLTSRYGFCVRTN